MSIADYDIASSLLLLWSIDYRQLCNIGRTKFPNSNVSRLVFQLPLPSPLKPGIQSRMKISWRYILGCFHYYGTPLSDEDTNNCYLYHETTTRINISFQNIFYLPTILSSAIHCVKENGIRSFCVWPGKLQLLHYCDAIMGTVASQITSLTIVYTTVYSDADQSKHQSSASLAFVRGIHRGPVNSPHKGPVTRKMFPFDDVIMLNANCQMRWLARFIFTLKYQMSEMRLV